ncbi:MAG TPA: beta-glucosidase [Nocardioidaceae bacterium]|nr:beta-glucosidase [Nocardioidaceae bacterium]
MTRTLQFPPGFVWGTATAAYQIEGAANDDGRRPSIWDTFCHTPGKVLDGDTGDVACDHYHRLEEDLDLMASLKLSAYRFSVSWPRVLPDAGAQINRPGLDFYDRLVDGLLARGVSPLLTLYHWDLPQPLEDAGGWLNRDTADRFADYATVIGQALGDRVSTITTLNEPFCSAFLGYATGVHAPGVRDNASALTAAHHLNLAHGRAVAALRAVTPADNSVSITLNIAEVQPATDSDGDLAAARHVDAIANGIFLEPILRGRYPAHLLEETRHITDWSFIHDGDLDIISAPIDVLGVNYYSPTRVVPAPIGQAGQGDDGKPDSGPELSPWPGTDRACSVQLPGPYTEMGWPIDPDGLTRLLTRLGRDYPEMPLVITENGCAYADVVSADGKVHDSDRIDYLARHLAAAHAAIEAGVDLRGYYAWSLMDNFEWAYGYSKRFGIVYVDYETLDRIPKDSAHWYRDVITANAVPVPGGRDTASG